MRPPEGTVARWVHSDWKSNLTITLDIIYFSPVLDAKFPVLTAANRLHKTTQMKATILNSEHGMGLENSYENRIPMQFWAEDDIPIEKLLLKGTASLSDAELLSILIGSQAHHRKTRLTLPRKSWQRARTTSVNSGNMESLTCKK